MGLPNWSIVVPAARSVVSKAAVQAKDITDEETKLRSAVTTAAGGVNSPLIAGALATLYDTYLGGVLQTAGSRATNACTATGNAITAYEHGQAQMAANANAQADKAPKVDLPGAK